jgi:hypothetical protein
MSRPNACRGRFDVVEINPGGMHGRYSAIWEPEGQDVWAVGPDPDLPLPGRVYFGRSFGAVRFDRQAGLCHVELRSRHGGVLTFSRPASSMDEACAVLVAAIGRVRSNPMWVEGFDTIFGRADDLRPGPQPTDDYALEWCDRFGTAINLLREARCRPDSPIMKAARRQGRLPLYWHVDQAAELFRAGTLHDGQVGAERVRELMAWGYSLATGTIQELTDAGSDLSLPQRRELLSKVSHALVGGQLQTAAQAVIGWPARRR